MLTTGRGSLPLFMGITLAILPTNVINPEQTLLYQFIRAHYPTLVDDLAQEGKFLPHRVHQEFKAYLRCGRLEYGFPRVRCDKCHFERLVAFCPVRSADSVGDAQSGTPSRVRPVGYAQSGTPNPSCGDRWKQPDDILANVRAQVVKPIYPNNA